MELGVGHSGVNGLNETCIRKLKHFAQTYMVWTQFFFCELHVMQIILMGA